MSGGGGEGSGGEGGNGGNGGNEGGESGEEGKEEECQDMSEDCAAFRSICELTEDEEEMNATRITTTLLVF